MITVTLPLRVVSRLNQREHWAKTAKRSKDDRWLAFVYLRDTRIRPSGSGPLTITMTRLIGPRGRNFDCDAVPGSCKSIRDGVADWLGTDDGHPSLTWRYQQIRAPAWGVRIEIVTSVEEALRL